MNSGRREAFRVFGQVTYFVFAVILALMAVGITLITDGPVSLWVRFFVFALVMAIFYVPKIIWRRLSRNRTKQ